LNITQTGFGPQEAIHLGLEEFAVGHAVPRIGIIQGIQQGRAQGLNDGGGDVVHRSLEGNPQLNQIVVFAPAVLVVVIQQIRRQEVQHVLHQQRRRNARAPDRKYIGVQDAVVEVVLVFGHLSSLSVVGLGASERGSAVEHRFHIRQRRLVQPGERLGFGNQLVALAIDIDVVVDRTTRHRKDAVHQEVHRVGYALEAAFVVDVTHLEEDGSHDFPEQPQVGVVGQLPALFVEHVGEQLVQPQHQGVALEVSLDGAIAVRFVFIGIEKIVEIELSDAEKAKMQESAEGVKKTNGLLDV